MENKSEEKYTDKDDKLKTMPLKKLIVSMAFPAVCFS